MKRDGIEFTIKVNALRVSKRCMFSAHMILALFIVLGFAGSKKLQSQEQVSSSHKWFDSMTGQTNSGIFKGVAYNNEFRVISDRHQFFEKADFSTGSVVFDQQSYFDLQLRYDVYKDNLQIINTDVFGLPVIILDKSKIKAFRIGAYLFENIEDLTNKKSNLSGMVQVIARNDSLTLYKKHHKKPLKRTDDSSVYFEFKNSHSNSVYYEFKNSHNYYVLYENRHHLVKNISDFATIFPSLKKQLKSIHNKHVVLKKKNEEEYMKSVVSDLLVIIHLDNLEE